MVQAGTRKQPRRGLCEAAAATPAPSAAARAVSAERITAEGIAAERVAPAARGAKTDSESDSCAGMMESAAVAVVRMGFGETHQGFFHSVTMH